MLKQNLNKRGVEDEFVILPDFCLHCDAEVSRKIIEKDRFNIPQVITFEYFCGVILTSINYHGDNQRSLGHKVVIKSGCANAILEGYNKLGKGHLKDHKMTEFKRG